jgi:hypothetical protein
MYFVASKRTNMSSTALRRSCLSALSAKSYCLNRSVATMLSDLCAGGALGDVWSRSRVDGGQHEIGGGKRDIHGSGDSEGQEAELAVAEVRLNGGRVGVQISVEGGDGFVGGFADDG